MQTDFERAVREGDLAALDRLLDAGADVNSRDAHGQTAMMLAAQRGHVAVVRSLVDRGADLNHAAKYHLTALMLAVVNGHVEVVQALVAAGADRSIRGSGAPGFSGKTAYHLAEARGDRAMMVELEPER